MMDARSGTLEEGQYGLWMRAINMRTSYKGKSFKKADLSTTRLVRQEIEKDIRKEDLRDDASKALLVDVSRGL